MPLSQKKREKLEKKAHRYLLRGDAFVEAQRHKKAWKAYETAASIFADDLGAHEAAEDCFFRAAKAYLAEGHYALAAGHQRNAANECILLGDFERANKYYQIATKYYLKEDQIFDSILNGSYAFLTLFVQGHQDKALDYIKRVRSNVPFEEFRENQLVQLVRSLTVAIVDKKFEELETIQANLTRFKFRPAEEQLIRQAVKLARTHVTLDLTLHVPRDEYTLEEIIDFTLDVDASHLTPDLYREVVVKDLGVTTSENLSLKGKPALPITIPFGNAATLKFKARVNFPEDDTHLGPILLTCVLGENTPQPVLRFFAKSPIARFQTVSPPAKIGIHLEELAPPVINQTFPLEVTLSNESEGEAVQVQVDLEFPPELRLMRGTAKKSIYSMAPNQEFKFQLQLKPKEPGEFPIKVTMEFQDANGNHVGPKTVALPFAINL